jgi:hypothetical protein
MRVVIENNVVIESEKNKRYIVIEGVRERVSTWIIVIVQERSMKDENNFCE